MSIYKAGQFNVPNYQISGLPFVTSSTAPSIIEFPYLTQWILLKTPTSVRVAFSQGSFSTLNQISGLSTTFTQMVVLPIRIKKLYVLLGRVDIIAGLTTIETGFDLVSTAILPALSASTDLNSTNIFSYPGI
jgi:hypothetical protein